MTDKPLVLFGVGELAEVAAYYFETEMDRPIAAFTVDASHAREATFLGRPVVAFEALADKLGPDACDMFVAIGYSGVNALRRDKCLAAKARGYQLASYVSSRASIASNARFGWNAFVLEDNTVQPFVTVGNGVTLWCGNHIGHHATIGDFVFISSHVVISGGVKVGERTFMGVNSTTNDHITIGARCVIGSGSIVTKDVGDEGVLSMEPAKLSPVPSRRLKGF
jgi:sugar O-acyltransferase (sialic acid O-acetyltransferase NeuD family)